MSSIVLRDILKHKIRKQILKNNKKINHKSFVKSMQFSQKIPFLMKYHKKKLVFFLVLSIIIWNYRLDKTVYHWILGVRSPHKILLGMLVDMPQVQEKTVSQMSMHRVQLQQETKDTLIKIYYEGDKYMYFGIGRKYLYEVYSKIGLLQKQDEKKMYWQKSQYHKKRNQLASGVSLVEYLQMFQQGFKKRKENDNLITEKQFLDEFLKSFLESAPQVMKWEKEFNTQRQKQFIKNPPGLSEAKKQAISQILKQNPSISIQNIQQKLKTMGLRGLNLSDKYYYHRAQQVWSAMKELNIKKALSHPNISFNPEQKSRLQKQLQLIIQTKQKASTLKEQDVTQYKKMYQTQLI